jgi:hypothetical protein
VEGGGVLTVPGTKVAPFIHVGIGVHCLRIFSFFFFSTYQESYTKTTLISNFSSESRHPQGQELLW